MSANLENSAVATGLKGQFHSNPKKGNAKEYCNHCRIVLISHANKVMLKILQARLQQYVNWGHTDTQAMVRKGSGTRDQIVKICWIMEKARKSQKTICFIDYCEAFDCMDHKKEKKRKNCGKLLKRQKGRNTRLPLIASWETCMWVKKWQLYWTWKSGLMQNRERSTTKPCLVTLFI